MDNPKISQGWSAEVYQYAKFKLIRITVKYELHELIRISRIWTNYIEIDFTNLDELQ